MSYPTLEQYNEAFQNPQFALSDPELKSGTIATTGLGLPLALCGGFALTYTLKCGSKKYAVRCFHKQSSELEKRYSFISNKLRSLNSKYFVDFEFQPRGVKILGKAYPVVKMAWAAGITLGEFLESRFQSPSDLQALATSLRELSQYLISQNIAHGDIQPGNLMVSDAGRKIQLIDYDGIFVDDLRSMGSAELGHRNFQHPNRTSSTWDLSIDRFSFIALDLALRALQANPDLWRKTQSDGDSILFKANDFVDPTRSAIFSELFAKKSFEKEARNFAAVCKAPYEKVPALTDFIADRNIPQITLQVVPKSDTTKQQYLSAFPVLDATNYAACLIHVGDKVEIIGQVVEVKEDKTRHGKPYVFINFGPWQGSIVKIAIWSEGLAAISDKPSQSWTGKWLSVVGLMEPPYVSRRYKYSHLGISITQGSQLHVISAQEAKFRLTGSSNRKGAIPAPSSNREILENIRGDSSTVKQKGAGKSLPPLSHNQAVIQQMKKGQSAGKPQPPNNKNHPQYPKKQPSSSFCFIATCIYGHNATETNILRRWRDKRLLTHKLGRSFVAGYYLISPKLVPYLERHILLRRVFKVLVGTILRFIDKNELSQD